MESPATGLLCSAPKLKPLKSQPSNQPALDRFQFFWSLAGMTIFLRIWTVVLAFLFWRYVTTGEPLVRVIFAAVAAIGFWHIGVMVWGLTGYAKDRLTR